MQAFISAAKAKLNTLTGVAPAEAPIKVGDRVRYRDHERIRRLTNGVGRDKGYVGEISNGRVYYENSGYDPAELLEVIPWIEWRGGPCPVATGQVAEVQFFDGDKDEDEDEACQWRDGCWTWKDETAGRIVRYRVLMK